MNPSLPQPSLASSNSYQQIICALFLVDIVGRKRSLLIGILLQSISMIYVAGFLTAIPNIADKQFKPTLCEAQAATVAIVMIFLSGFGWAMGWNSMQYLLTAELFPLRIRAAATSLVMCAHFANSYGNSRAVPNMLLPVSDGGLSPMGTFWMFAAVTILGGIWVWVTIPETKGRSLESMDVLFTLPWYKIGLYGNKHAVSGETYAQPEKKREDDVAEQEVVEHKN